MAFICISTWLKLAPCISCGKSEYTMKMLSAASMKAQLMAVVISMLARLISCGQHKRTMTMLSAASLKTPLMAVMISKLARLIGPLCRRCGVQLTGYANSNDVRRYAVTVALSSQFIQGK